MKEGVIKEKNKNWKEIERREEREKREGCNLK